MRLPSRPCDDDRLLRARRGELTGREWREHSDHLAACADCRMDWLVGRDFDESAAVRPGDELVVAAAAKAALEAPRTGWLRVSRVAVAAAVLLTAVASASGAILWRMHVTAARSSVAEQEAKKPARRVSRAAPSAVPPAAVTLPPAPVAEMVAPPVESPPPAATAAPAPPPSPKTRPRRPLALVPPAPAPTTPPVVVDEQLDPPKVLDTAHGLLAQAMAERQQGRRQSAILALRSLRRQFPDSSEGAVALVSLGNLLLDGHEAAEALPLFQRYCAQLPSGALAPEALAGQARSFEQLGRAVDAKVVWRELVRRFPGSPYARSKASLGAEEGGL